MGEYEKGFYITIDNKEIIRNFISSKAFDDIKIDEHYKVPILNHVIGYGYENIDFLGCPEDAITLLKAEVDIGDVSDEITMDAEERTLAFFKQYMLEVSGVRLETWTSNPGVDCWIISVTEEAEDAGSS